MNSFLEYAICNRGTGAYHHLEQSSPSFPSCSGSPSSDTFHGEGRYGAGGSAVAAAHLPPQSPGFFPAASGRSVPFAAAAPSAGYPTQNCSPGYGHHQLYLGQQDADGVYFQAAGYSSSTGPHLGSLAEGYCGAVGQYQQQQHLYGQEQPGYLPGVYGNLSPSLNEDKDPACPSEPCPNASSSASNSALLGSASVPTGSRSCGVKETHSLWGTVWGIIWGITRGIIWDAVWVTAWVTVWGIIWGTLWGTVWGITWGIVRDTAWGTV